MGLIEGSFVKACPQGPYSGFCSTPCISFHRKGPVIFFIPLRGWSNYDPPGSVLYAPEEDRIPVKAPKKSLRHEIEVKEIDANLEDPIFAKVSVDGFADLMSRDRQ